MSEFDEKVNEALAAAKTLGIEVDSVLLSKVAKGLGPSIYKADASLVSSSDTEELDRVKTNFLKGKLGCTNEADMDAAITHAINTFGSSNRNKLRILFYYLCVVKLDKSSVY
ncbi:MAG: DUF2853 family protein [Saprospiraceae bacterium]